MDNDADIDGSDVKTYFAYDERWRVVGTYASPTAAGPTERWVHHAAGLAGTGGSSSIDSVVLRDRDVVLSGTGSSYGGDALEERVYVLQNWRADVVATLGRTGTLIEWIQYTPYGMAVTNPPGNADFNGDGGVDGGDTEAFFLAWEGGLPSADINNDGAVDIADIAAFDDIWEAGETPQAGLCMLTAIRVGYAGYQWDGSVNHDRTVSGAMAGLYHVRHRVYDPELGRWTRRDPLGYVDGSTLYEYVRSTPISSADPQGLRCEAFNCPNRLIKKPGHERSQNGCGGGGLQHIIPDNPFGYQFKNCCIQHDYDYTTCSTDRNDRRVPDDAFCDCLLDKCKAPEWAIDRWFCRRIARIYCRAVRVAGGLFYCDSQKEACYCCLANDPNPLCRAGA